MFYGRINFFEHACDLLILAKNGVTLEQWAVSVRNMGMGKSDNEVCEKILKEAKEYSNMASNRGMAGGKASAAKRAKLKEFEQQTLTSVNDRQPSNSNSNSNSNSINTESIQDREIVVADATPSHSKKFCKPSLQEIVEYCKERNNSVNANTFFNFYESNGWKVGKNAMKSWKACVHTWEEKQKTFNQSQSTPSEFRRSSGV